MCSLLTKKSPVFFRENYTYKIQKYTGGGHLSNLLQTHLKYQLKFVSLLLDSPKKLW